MKGQQRESDQIARYGGEEFSLILPHTSSDGAFKVAERLREKIASLDIKYENQVISLTMSFGVASCDQSENISVDELIKRADNALYEAKSAGKNRTHVSGGKNSKIIRFFKKKCNEAHEKRICK